MDLNSMLRCSTDSSTAALATAVVSLSKTYSKGLLVHMAACYSLNDAVLICAGFTVSSKRRHGQRLCTQFGKCTNSHVGI